MNAQEKAQLADIHRALFEVPPGSVDGEKPLIEKMVAIAKAYERGSWFARFFIWSLPALAGVGVAIERFATWFKWGGAS